VTDHGVALITGGTDGIGNAAARLLTDGREVVIVGPSAAPAS
jgi:NAD(P)-dependent dehydrogenase (short-subunit alcohol dehydrogenase family)